ncbi:MAG: molybdopterin-dependent oxidoreductase [Proteobacteria bacterium]|nr:molybdopterin-dependent oxidoreductase [Pseudomonadota bacterium]
MSNIDRRDFLKLVGAGSVGAGAGFMLAESIKHPVEYLIPYAVPPEDFSHGIATWYNSVCSMCPAGCGITVRTREGRAKKIEGNPSHPVNQGRLCALGQAGLQVLYNPDRLTAPMERTGDRGSGSFAQITWEDGLTRTAEHLASLHKNGQGNRVAFLSTGVRGHFASLLELFMEALGSDRLLHYDFAHPHTLYAANKRFFGEESLPYYDLQNTRFLLSFGADYLGRWISPVHHGLGFGHSRQGRATGRLRTVQIEPRMSISGAAADQWIPARPGTEGQLALGLAHHIVAEGGYAGDDRENWVAALRPYSVSRVADQTGVAPDTITRLADAFADTQPSLAIGGGAAGNCSNGVATLVAVNALNYLVGNLGKRGGLLFNPTPAFGSSSHPRQASYRMLSELAEDARNGQIEVLIINGANPVFNLPSAAGFEQAMAEIPFIVSLSSFLDETTAMADLILPSHTYLESWGDDSPEPGMGFAVGAISQPVVSPLYNTRASGDIILGLAQQMDLGEALPWDSMEDFLKARWREIYERGAPADELNGFESFWRSILQAGVWGEKTQNSASTFALDPNLVDNIGVETAVFSGDSEVYPFVLHPYLSNAFYDGRGANLPWMQELPDPLTSVVYGSWVEMNPLTAKKLGLSEGDLVRVESPHGEITAPVFVYPGIMPDVIAMPIGQGHAEFGRYAKDRGVNPISILAPLMDPDSGSLAWGGTRVKIEATGRQAKLLKIGGESRQLGREIIQTSSNREGANEHAQINSIPISVVSS